jgi:streptogramin lyase
MKKLILSTLVAVGLIGSAGAQSVLNNYYVTTIAGSGNAGFTNGHGTNATFNRPVGVAVDKSGNVYIADSANNAIRKIDTYGNVTTLAGGSGGFSDGQGGNASFNYPTAIAVDTFTNIYVADAANNAIRKIDPDGNVTTVAGNGSQGFSNGLANNATFVGPNGIAVGVSGNLYVSDYFNNAIRKIDNRGNVTTLAGNGNFGLTNGNGMNATFYRPVGIAVDRFENVYVADGNQHGYGAIRKIDANGNVTTFAGGENSGFADGQGSSAMFMNPGGLAFDNSGNLYVGDSENNSIRKVDPSTNVTTIAGQQLRGTYELSDGFGTNSTFNWPVGLAVDASSNIYVADMQNNAIRKIYSLINITSSLSQGLIAYYPLRGNAFDYSTNHNDGVISNAIPTLDEFGNPNSAYYFNGTNASIVASNRPYLNCLPITMNCWFQKSSTNYTGESFFILKYNSTSWNGYFLGGGDGKANSSIIPFYAGSYGNDIVDGYPSPYFYSSPVLDTNWHMATLTIDTNGAVIYIDGAANTNRSWRGTPQITTSSAPLTLGIFRGSMNDVRIYNRALSSVEISHLYTYESLLQVPSLTPQTITFPSLSPVIYGVPPFILAAAVSSALPVSYYSTSTNISILGGIVTVLGTGTATIVASQSGNSTYAAAPSITNTLVVNGPDSRLKNQAISFPPLKPRAWTNAPFALTAKASSILPITYTSSDATVATVSNGILTPVGVGTTTITAYQGGNTIYNPAKSVSQQQVITQATQKITFPVITPHTYGDAPFTLSATSTSSLPITYASLTPSVATVFGNVVTIVGAGTAKITASQSGNALYSAATPVSQTLKVAKANQTVIFNPTTPLSYTFGGIIPFSGSASSGLPITYTSSKASVITVGKGSSQGLMLSKGTTTITATQSGNANYNKASATATITLQ